ncbi:MAG: methyltransferase [Kofleriaceae bacterium]|nr:methyltransferase [Kofleriaceae bacterium]
MPHLVMSPQLYVLFSTLVEEASGILYGPQDQQVFASKLTDHVLDLGYSSLLDYYYRLRYDDPDGNEMRRLVETLVVHETYFFRELPPLIEIADHLTALVKQRGHARVWSAACASGEEPYTLAMLLDERGVLDQVEIVATDISAAVIARAAAGRHSPRSLRDGHPPAIAARYLEASPQGVIVSPRIRGAVTFSRLNLIDADGVQRLGLFDAILCRNVLIYFRDDRVLSVVEHLAKMLRPDGLLAVGVSESLLRAGTSLVCEERGGSFFYKRAS